MQNDNKKMPMTHIQERAPENKWMRNANAQPGPVGQHGVIDATMLDPNKVNPPRPDALPERGAGSVSGIDVQVPILQQEKKALEAEKAEATQEARDRKAEAEALGEQLQRMRTDLQQSNADKEALKKRISELKDAPTSDPEIEAKLAKAEEKVAVAEGRIVELEAREPEATEVEVEVEVFPRKITLSEVTNARKKNDILLVKGVVSMGEGEEDHNILLRIPYDDVASALKED